MGRLGGAGAEKTEKTCRLKRVLRLRFDSFFISQRLLRPSKYMYNKAVKRYTAKNSALPAPQTKEKSGREPLSLKILTAICFTGQIRQISQFVGLAGLNKATL